jgi:hypothetical protein
MKLNIEKYRLKYNKSKKYINELCFKYYIAVKGYLVSKDTQLKFKSFGIYLLEILITGFIIKYAWNNTTYMGIGIRVALITYYIEWFVKLMKSKE